jgi:putative ABC transport system substrate-binding protein
VIAATGAGSSILAAKAATATIPIVFLAADDPVREGYVASLRQPGGNITGVTWFNLQVGGKGLGLFRQLVPNATLIGLMVNPRLPESNRVRDDVQAAARALGVQLFVLNASTPSDIDAAFATLRERRA